MSGRCTPAAATFTNTSPSPGRGTGRSTSASSSAPSGCGATTAFMVAGTELLTAGGLLTSHPGGSTFSGAMDLDELFPDKPKDPLTELKKQDLDPLSVDELQDQIAALQIGRASCRERVDSKGRFRGAPCH